MTFISPFSSTFHQIYGFSSSTTDIFTPASIASLQLDVNPALGVYQDVARTIPAAADGTIVLGVEDQSGKGNHGAQATSSAGPLLKLNIANGKPSLRFVSSDYLNFSGIASRTDTSGAIYAVVRLNSANQTGFLVGSSDEATNLYLFAPAIKALNGNNRINITQRNGPGINDIYGNTRIDTFTHICAWESNSSSWSMTVDGALEVLSSAGGTNTGAWLGGTPFRDNFWLGQLYFGGPFFPYVGDVLRLLYFSAPLSIADKEAVLAYLAGQYGRGVVSHQVICDGDSITAGYSSNTSPWPAQLESLMGGDWRHQNLGVVAQTIVSMASDATTQVNVMFNPNLSSNIVCAFGGTNDLFFGATVATLQTNYQNYCAARQSAGFEVVAFTILPRSEGGVPGTFEADRQTFNTWLRANYATFADALADVAADTTIGDSGDELNTTYYQDRVHPTNAGAAIIAGIAQTAIAGL